MTTTFVGFLNSIIESQDVEVTLGRQPALADDGREVRAALQALPPEVFKSVVGEYKAASPALLAQAEEAIIMRELALENASSGKTLDKEWAAAEGTGRRMNENSAGGDDPWNLPDDSSVQW